MKKIFTITALAAAMIAAVTSCQKEAFTGSNDKNQIQGEDLVFYATLENTDTKTTIANEGAAGYKVSWEATDCISINGIEYVAVPDKENPAKATFNKKNNGDPEPEPPFKAYYPASIYDGTNATLPATQTYTDDGSIASILPMYAEGSDLNLNFKNLCGLMKFTLKGTEKVQHITLADDTKALSGKFTVSGNAAVLDAAAKGGITLDCGAGVELNDKEGKTFYVAVPAGSYEKLRIEYNTKDFANICEMKASTTAVVERNKVYSFDQTPTFRPDWFYFEAAKDGAKVALVTPPKAVNPPKEPSLLYSTDGGNNWNVFTVGSTSVTLSNIGDRVYFKAQTTNTTFGAEGPKDYYYFTTTDLVKVGGNIMYLLDGSNPAAATISSDCFKSLFDPSNGPEDSRQSFIVSASDLKLPATELNTRCYQRMFASCKMLKTVPALPATTLKNSCYYGMFNCCVALEAAPALPATNLAEMCYCAMFQSCTTLVAATALPATELAKSCYSQMFDGCSKLLTAPALPATKLAPRCYFKMFCNCIALVNPPSLPATNLEENCYGQMFISCSTMVAAPPLPADELKPGCYQMIFSKCVNLNSVTMLATNISAENCLDQWLGQKNEQMGEAPAGSQTTGWKVFVAKGMVDAVKAKVPDTSSPDWKGGVQEIK